MYFKYVEGDPEETRVWVLGRVNVCNCFDYFDHIDELWNRPATSLLFCEASEARTWDTFMILSCCWRTKQSSEKSSVAQGWRFWTLMKKVGWAEPQLVSKNPAELSKSNLLPGSGQEVFDALSALPAFLQLLWTRGLLRVGLDVTLWDGNLLWFGKLHVGNTSQLQ